MKLLPSFLILLVDLKQNVVAMILSDFSKKTKAGPFPLLLVYIHSAIRTLKS